MKCSVDGCYEPSADGTTRCEMHEAMYGREADDLRRSLEDDLFGGLTDQQLEIINAWPDDRRADVVLGAMLVCSLSGFLMGVLLVSLIWWLW